jgi:hypothetical protein
MSKVGYALALALLCYTPAVAQVGHDPARAPNDPPILDPLVNSESEWTSHPTLLIGLGYAFRF